MLWRGHQCHAGNGSARNSSRHCQRHSSSSSSSRAGSEASGAGGTEPRLECPTHPASDLAGTPPPALPPQTWPPWTAASARSAPCPALPALGSAGAPAAAAARGRRWAPAPSPCLLLAWPPAAALLLLLCLAEAEQVLNPCSLSATAASRAGGCSRRVGLWGQRRRGGSRRLVAVSSSGPRNAVLHS